ncbi:MAG TPA: SpoIID/LytB domain-containing protein [Patescibacteria group bacterium]|nr:SpoIID/LytB domain-containing protein [Patescibacteria group bacterium]
MSTLPNRTERPRLVPAPRRQAGRARWLTGLAGALVLAASSLGIRVSPVAADGAPPPVLADTTFFGRGYGHGVGMSQYGARGRAIAGQLAPAILAHYFAKTTLGQRDPATTVRVLLLTGFVGTAAKPLTVVGRGGSWTIDGVAKTFPPDAKATFVPTASGATSWTVRVVSLDGVVLHTATLTGYQYIRPAAPATLLQLASKATATNIYRGAFRIRLNTSAMVMNHVALDLYLRGVVPLEMPSSWPVEAIRAQTIAARSYAVYRLHPTVGTYDVFDDSRSQVYRGQRAETAAGTAAVTATAGKVLLSGTAVVNAMFHSAAGGWTENNENVFVTSSGQVVAGAVTYLRGSSDRAPDGTAYDKDSPYATWRTLTYTSAALSTILAKDARTDVGTLMDLDLSRRGVSGRLISVTLTGSLGTKTVSGGVFRTAFNAGRPAGDPMLRSTLFDTQPIP